MAQDGLGDRMKTFYEDRNRLHLTRKIPVIMRLDGRAFHSLTKKYEKPFSNKFRDMMSAVAEKLMKEIQGAKFAYVQSDEISILMTDFDRKTTEGWFNYNVQKMCSIAASIASVEFHRLSGSMVEFDCRVFNIPKEEVKNYFIWRYHDWTRNALQMYARSLYSQKELNKKNRLDMHSMIDKKAKKKFEELDSQWQHGTSVHFIYGEDYGRALVTVCKKISSATKVFDDLMKPLEEDK